MQTTAVVQRRGAGKGYHCLRYQCTLMKTMAMVHRRGAGKGYHCLRYQCTFDEDNGGGASKGCGERRGSTIVYVISSASPHAP